MVVDRRSVRRAPNRSTRAVVPCVFSSTDATPAAARSHDPTTPPRCARARAARQQDDLASLGLPKGPRVLLLRHLREHAAAALAAATPTGGAGSTDRAGGIAASVGAGANPSSPFSSQQSSMGFETATAVVAVASPLFTPTYGNASQANAASQLAKQENEPRLAYARRVLGVSSPPGGNASDSKHGIDVDDLAAELMLSPDATPFVAGGGGSSSGDGGGDEPPLRGAPTELLCPITEVSLHDIILHSTTLYCNTVHYITL